MVSIAASGEDQMGQAEKETKETCDDDKGEAGDNSSNDELDDKFAEFMQSEGVLSSSVVNTVVSNGAKSLKELLSGWKPPTKEGSEENPLPPAVERHMLSVLQVEVFKVFKQNLFTFYKLQIK